MRTPFAKQFLIGPSAVRVEPDWLSVELAPGLHLSYSPHLQTRRLRTRDGGICYLMGTAASASAESVEREIASSDLDGIDRVTALWAGKWALISAGRCISDASGCLGLHYRDVAGWVWISSNPVILGKRLPVGAEAPVIDWQVTHGAGMDWIPPPLTSREGVYKLLPQRAIEPLTGRISLQGELPTHGPSMREFLISAMEAWHRGSDCPKRIALTAGLDTRTVLAAAVRAGLRLPTFTTLHRHVRWGDRRLPSDLAKQVGFRHSFMRGRATPFSERRRRLHAAAESVDGLFIHPKWETYAAGGFDACEAPQSIAGGNVFEVGRCFYWRRLDRETPGPDQLVQRFFGRPPPLTERWVEALDRWRASLFEDHPLTMDWRDRFYLEQRLGGWLSQVHRANDFIGLDVFMPANSRWFMHLMLQAPHELRRDGKRQLALVAELAPPLATLPINPPSPLVTLKRAVKRVAPRVDARFRFEAWLQPRRIAAKAPAKTSPSVRAPV